ncbi:hypothetical protein LuPra_05388 [Luteitalea pratensis]|uniref:Uncharacterized protein n=1 Tax=Luteitalea pratensis TaxID=1855912 RepID=A0A143PUY4_LUTPR|nr:hypothetical protein [Luteitalea pratensis]AMY12116.1 hypothetical protein LuPra_05388 [Luteitalea pratensis]
MAINKKLLSIIGKKFPSIYDVNPPHGPFGRVSWVALNPQPLPPMGIGAAMATDLLHHAWVGERTGLDPAGALRFLEDLCPPYPRRPKLPPVWPPVPDPDPGPDWYAEYYLGFAARLAAVPGDQMAGRMREFFDKALDQSIASLEKAVG